MSNQQLIMNYKDVIVVYFQSKESQEIIGLIIALSMH